MTHAKLAKLTGNLLHVVWRDPTSLAGWSEHPLEHETAEAQTFGFLVGFNGRGEAVIASTISAQSMSELTALPIGCIEKAEVVSKRGKTYSE